MLSRRTFLATTAMSGAWLTARSASPPAPFLKVALATGVLERAVGCDVGDQIAAAARLGFRHFDDSQWSGRPVEEQQRIVQVARTHGVTLGPLDCPAFSVDDEDWRRWQSNCIIALRRAQAAGFRAVRMSVGPSLNENMMACGFAAIWRKVVDAVPGCDLLIEPWDDGRRGRHHFRKVLIALRTANRSNLRLSVRATQWQDAGYGLDELFNTQDFFWDISKLVGRVELSDHDPADNVDLVRGLARLHRAGADVTCVWGASASPTELVLAIRRLEEAVLLSTPDRRNHA